MTLMDRAVQDINEALGVRCSGIDVQCQEVWLRCGRGVDPDQKAYLVDSGGLLRSNHEKPLSTLSAKRLWWASADVDQTRSQRSHLEGLDLDLESGYSDGASERVLGYCCLP